MRIPARARRSRPAGRHRRPRMGTECDVGGCLALRLRLRLSTSQGPLGDPVHPVHQASVTGFFLS